MIYIVKKKDPVIIGQIDFTEMEENLDEISIASDQNKKLNLSGIGLCNVFVYPNEGPIPHVHVLTSDKTWGTCICLHDAYYFPHGDNKLTKGVFNRKNANIFDEWMREDNSYIKGSNFRYAVNSWINVNETPYPTFNKISQPDYTDMKGDFNPELRIR